MASVRIGSLEYTRRDFTPKRRGEVAGHGWLRRVGVGDSERRAEIGMEGVILVDEVVALRALLRGLLDTDPMGHDSKENYRCSFCFSEDVEYVEDEDDVYLHHSACAWLVACDRVGKSHFGHRAVTEGTAPKEPRLVTEHRKMAGHSYCTLCGEPWPCPHGTEGGADGR